MSDVSIPDIDYEVTKTDEIKTTKLFKLLKGI